MYCALPVLVLVQSTLLLASIAGAPSYSSVAGDAAIISNLGRFLEAYVGDCLADDPEFDRAGCDARAAAHRRTVDGDRYRLEVDDLTAKVRLHGWDKRRRAFRLLLTPFFSDRNLALTFQQPVARKGDGLPSVKNIPIWVKLPPSEAEFAFRRRLERGMVRVELVVVPQKPWAIKRRDGEGWFRGMKARLLGLRLLGLRSDAVLAEQTY